ncbi:MAG TPA: hypothetical protein VNQ77_13495 [Frankiaceae bacterium]|nr:hypothetical protein [Frankiaceae bacterium]
MDSDARGREVRLVDVPVALYRETQQHTDSVLRELVLMAGYEVSHDTAGPMRGLFQRANDGFADRLDLTVRATPAVDAAHERGDAYVTLTLTLPERYAASVQLWARLVEELDAYCQDGTMLCVPASDEVKAFAQWWCAELTRQLRTVGAPTPWRDYVATTGSFVA